MIQSYIWHLTPEDGNVDRLCDNLKGPVGDLLRYNRWVADALIELEEDFIALTLTLKGHDRWWVRKRVPPLIASVAIRSGLKLTQVKHMEIRTEPSLKNAQYYTEDGRRVFEPPDGVFRPTIVRKRKEKEPKHFLHCTGWKTGTQVINLDLRTMRPKRGAK